jgi:protein phosphatase PTC1
MDDTNVSDDWSIKPITPKEDDTDSTNSFAMREDDTDSTNSVTLKEDDTDPTNSVTLREYDMVLTNSFAMREDDTDSTNSITPREYDAHEFIAPIIAPIITITKSDYLTQLIDCSIKCIGANETQNNRYRHTMEDVMSIDEFTIGDNQYLLLTVLDGHGGSTVSNMASIEIPKIMYNKLSNGAIITKEYVEESFTSCFDVVNQILESKGKIYGGSTVICALIEYLKDGVVNLYTSGAGDSRITLCYNNMAKRMTYDHKGADESEVERIRELGGFVVSGRVNGMLAVTRAIGDLTFRPYVISKPDCSFVTITDDCKWLILACDGLWDVVTDDMALELIKDCVDADTASRKLVNEALVRGTTDNVSVIVYEFI